MHTCTKCRIANKLRAQCQVATVALSLLLIHDDCIDFLRVSVPIRAIQWRLHELSHWVSSHCRAVGTDTKLGTITKAILST